ncbi:hypothetical protein [Occallatibacter savannae]|uniref:hypothetical protein n=1 Tax=Occallatibacter savannae TaxID=1002691 RepID=UPI000D68C43F|nr:hypothetical protein [Occallatibacter savannae]
MHQNTWTQTKPISLALSADLMLAAASLVAVVFIPARLAAQAQQTPSRSHARHVAKRMPMAQEVVQAPAPPPMPNWPVNDKPNPPSVVWDASGLRINASNSSLQQILSEVSTDTGTKVVGNVPDQRVFGSYGPGQASDVLLQLLQGSGYNVLLAGDLGQGAPSQIVLTPRRGGSANSSAGTNPQQQQQMQPQDQDDVETGDQQPEQPEQPEETVPAIPPTPQQMNQGQPGTGPNGPIRTPQEIMQEMQQRQLLQQQQMQQQMQQQQGNPTAPQQQDNPQ